MRRKTLAFTVSMLLLMGGATQAHADKRVALVIGNSAYKTNTIKTATNNATAISGALKRMGFDVILRQDLTRAKLDTAVSEFDKKLSAGADIALFYYTGRGAESTDDIWLFGVDSDTTRVKRANIANIAYPFYKIVELAQCKSNVALAFYDAARTEPFKNDAKKGVTNRPYDEKCKGKWERTMISFATSRGRGVIEGEGEFSPFTGALLKHLESPDSYLADVMIKVRGDTMSETQNRQIPWEHSSLSADFKLN